MNHQAPVDEQAARLERDRRAMEIAKETKALREKLANRDAEEEEEEAALELEELRLDAQLADEVGKRGKDYEIVRTDFGVFGVRKPDARGVQAWDRATTESKSPSSDKLAMILRHYIVPESKQIEFHTVATDRPGIVTGANSVGAAFLSLIGAAKFDRKKKS